MKNRYDNCIVYILHNIHTKVKIKAVQVWRTDTIIVLLIYITQSVCQI